MKFPYKVKIGDEIIPAGTEIPENNKVGAAENVAPVVSEPKAVEREATVPEEPKKRGRQRK